MKDKIEKLYEKYKTEAFLFTNKIETFYLTGAAFDGFWILALKERIHVICPKMIENQVREYFSNRKIDIYIGVPMSSAVCEILKNAKVKELSVDPRYLNAADFLLIKDKLEAENIKLIAKSGILDELRAVKSKSEVETIKEACRIVSEVCAEVKKELKPGSVTPGLTELDIHFRILELFAKNKVKESFTPIVAAGKNSANPHHASSNYKIKANDVIMMDIGCIYKGYCSDLTRTYFLGKINGKIKKIWDIVKTAHTAVLNEIKAGLPVSAADKAARDIIEAAGYGSKFIHNTGHGVGIEIHEMPSLAKNAEGVFLEGMTVTAEPGIYLEGEFGVRIEDTALVKDRSCEILTTAEY
ncbi:MAG: aminopeptidase P family protein [Endomicrobia bacterium]|nr:aminopeptidase P family protein [Endomicrobiia bacterium]